MKRFVERIRVILDSLQDFKEHVENRTGVLISSIERAITAIYQFTLVEIRTMTNTAELYSGAFAQRYLNDLTPMKYILPNIIDHISVAEEIANRCFEMKFITTSEILNMCIFHIDNAIKHAEAVKDYSQICPNYFWMQGQTLPKCYIKLKRISDSLHNTTHLIRQICSNSGNNSEDMYDEIRFLKQTMKTDLAGTAHCKFDFISVLQDTKQTMKGVEGHIITQLDAKLLFNYTILLEKLHNELRNIYTFERELSSLLTAYARNETTKLKIAKYFSQFDIVNGDTYFERIMWQLDEKVFDHFSVKIKAMEYNVREWLMTGIRAMGDLLPYCRSDIVESAIRQLRIWRYPLVNLDAREFIVYLYKPEETWRAWPTSMSFVDMLEKGQGLHVVRNITMAFGQVLIEPISGFKSDMHNTFSEIKTYISDLKGDLDGYRVDNTLNNNFIM